MTLLVTERRLAVRAILAGQRVIRPASVYDPLSIRAAALAGYEMAMLAGSVASLAVVGAPDLVLLTQTELADLCRRIARSSHVPLMVDADHGFGNALNVWRTVQELDAAGVAALTIEDTMLPNAFGSEKGQLISLEEAGGKIRAAAEGRHDPQTVVIARTNVSMSSIEDIATRASAYEAAGADAIFLSSAKSRDQVKAVAQMCSLPLVLGQTSNELTDEEFLMAHRVRVVLQSHRPIMAAIQAVCDTYAGQRHRAQLDDMPRVVSKEFFAQLVDEAEYDRLGEETLK